MVLLPNRPATSCNSHSAAVMAVAAVEVAAGAEVAVDHPPSYPPAEVAVVELLGVGAEAVPSASAAADPRCQPVRVPVRDPEVEVGLGRALAVAAATFRE